MAHLALDIGGTKIRAGVVEAEHVIRSVAVPTLAHEGGEAVMERILDLVREVGPGEGVGIAAAGVIRDGSVVSATDLMPGWAGVRVRERVAEIVDVPCEVIGDVHAHGIGEALLGAGAGRASCLTVAVGTGIGGAFVEGGLVSAGAHGLAGHIGHLSVAAAAGLPCSCGRSGHIEALASGSAVTARYRELTGEDLGGREIDERASSGEEAARTVLFESARALGEVIANAANLLDPEVIVLSGSMTRSGNGWWSALSAGYEACAMDLARPTPILPGMLGDEAPLLGAVMNLRRQHP